MLTPRDICVACRISPENLRACRLNPENLQDALAYRRSNKVRGTSGPRHGACRRSPENLRRCGGMCPGLASRRSKRCGVLRTRGTRLALVFTAAK